jgi:hypothetical protein
MEEEGEGNKRGSIHKLLSLLSIGIGERGKILHMSLR